MFKNTVMSAGILWALAVCANIAPIVALEPSQTTPAEQISPTERILVCLRERHEFLANVSPMTFVVHKIINSSGIPLAGTNNTFGGPADFSDLVISALQKLDGAHEVVRAGQNSEPIRNSIEVDGAAYSSPSTSDVSRAELGVGSGSWTLGGRRSRADHLHTIRLELRMSRTGARYGNARVSILVEVRQRTLESGVEYAITGIKIGGSNASESPPHLINNLVAGIEIGLAHVISRRFGLPAAGCSPDLGTDAIKSEFNRAFTALHPTAQVLMLQRALAAANHPIELSGVIDAPTLQILRERGMDETDLARATMTIMDGVKEIDEAIYKLYAATVNSAGEIALQSPNAKAMLLNINGTPVDPTKPAWAVSEGPATLAAVIYPAFIREIFTYVIGGQRQTLGIQDAPPSAWVTVSAAAPTPVFVDDVHVGDIAAGKPIMFPVAAGRRIFRCAATKPTTVTVAPNKPINLSC